MVESRGEILVVVRVMVDEKREFKNDYLGVTKMFQVFKLDVVGNKWVEVNSLGDRSLFLGGNHSISIATNTDGASCNDLFHR
ncbi:hypothetical protein SLA2020_363270 [Shorea laevis]